MSEKSYGKRVEMPVDSISKAHTWLPDGPLACGVQNCGCKQASGAHSAVAQDAKMEIWLRRHRGLLVAALAVAFLGYLVWEAHTPGEARTMPDFLFLLALTGVPFLIFLYNLWSWITWSEVAAEDSRRSGLAIQGLALGGASAAMLILLLPLWSFVIEHEKVAVFWVGAGVLMAAAATVCGIAGAPRLRRAALLSVILLPFWLFAAGLLLKAVMD